MDHQLLSTAGLVLCFLMIVTYFGARILAGRGRYRAASISGYAAVVVALLMAARELGSALTEHVPVRFLLAVCWAGVACAVFFRARGMAEEAADLKADKERAAGGRTFRRRY